MNNCSQQAVIKVETKNERYEIVYDKGIFLGIQNGEIIFQHEDYEVVRYYLLGW